MSVKGWYAVPMGETLGRLTRVSPRDVWKHEARDFTRWLAENIDRLGELLNLDLEVEGREVDVGDFSADIAARDLGSGRRVVIENQLEHTDHSHLGQLLTYAAGLEAGVVVWVSPEFRPEHQQALDWLNRGDDTETEFFGVVVEVLRIDSSAPAVNFRLAVAPNKWARSSRRGETAGEVSVKGAAYQAFFQVLIDELREKHGFTAARAALPQSWFLFSSGTSGLRYGASFALGGELRTEVYIDLGDQAVNKAAFAKLAADRETIERDFGEPLRWEELPTKKASRVACYAPGSILDPTDRQEVYRRWMIERLLKFKRIFGPRLPDLAKLAIP